MIIDGHTHMHHEKSLGEFTRLGGHWAQQKVANLVDNARKIFKLTS